MDEELDVELGDEADEGAGPEDRLDSFDPAERSAALRELAAAAGAPAEGSNVNMHFHSFFSFNAEDWSPSRIAWESRQAGLYAAGLCDFDVLDGLEEFLQAGLTLGLRATVNLETRAFVKEYAAADINSPGEPGVAYILGAGFVAKPLASTPEGRQLAAFRDAARRRNEALVGRLNERLPAIAVNHVRQVLPLTPQGAATERHIVRAYAARAAAVFPEEHARARFWAPLLKRTPAQCTALEADAAAFEEAVRAALVKRGGLGYVAPDTSTFPPAKAFIDWVRACDAIPTIAWLDGTSAGEAHARRLLDHLRDAGCAALNIIPDRNWNPARPQERKTKIAKLDEIVRLAEAMELPINIGTEMNRAGQPFADDLAGPELSRHRAAFLRGAQVMIGHSVLARFAAAPYLGARASQEFPRRRARNRFYAAVGALPPLVRESADHLLDVGPERAFAMLADAAQKVAAR